MSESGKVCCKVKPDIKSVECTLISMEGASRSAFGIGAKEPTAFRDAKHTGVLDVLKVRYSIQRWRVRCSCNMISLRQPNAVHCLCDV